MKVRKSFVSNSSSTSFIITNISDKPKTLVNFVQENPQLVEQFCKQYHWHNFSQEDMIKSAEARMASKTYQSITWKPHESLYCTFGDEDGDAVGNVYDYILRDGGVSENFRWSFHEFYR